MILDGKYSMTKIEVPNMTSEAQNRRKCLATDRWIISWMGLKSVNKQRV